MTPAEVFWLFVALVYSAGTTAGCWGLFAKAGEPGWAALVPGYNLLVLVRISGLWWWLAVLFLLPLVNMGFPMVVCDQRPLKFRKGVAPPPGLTSLRVAFSPLLALWPA